MSTEVIHDQTLSSAERRAAVDQGAPLLAFDLGRTTGWAVRFADGNYLSGVWRLRGPNATLEGAGMVYLQFHRFLTKLLDTAQPALVVYEGVRFFKGADAARMYGGLFGQLTALLEARQIPYMAVPPSVVKKHATGSGKANKTLMVERAEARWPGFEPETDDEADARWIASYGACASGAAERVPHAPGRGRGSAANPGQFGRA